MKFFGYILRNARRNPIRSILTVGSLSISLFLSMVLISFVTVNDEVSKSTRGNGRIIMMSSQGFAQPVPIARLAELKENPEILAASPLAWYGGKFRNESTMFAQFGVDPDSFFKIYDELDLPEDQQKAWKDDPNGCVIGAKLAGDYKLKVGDPFPLQGDLYPYNLDLVVRGIYTGPANRDQRMCVFNWWTLDQGLRNNFNGQMSGNAGAVIMKLKDDKKSAAINKSLDDQYRNSDAPSRTQTEEAFTQMFAEMAGDFQWIIVGLGLAVGVSLICVSGNAMAMALRERTTEVAVLKAIGFGKGLVLYFVLAESIMIALMGGLIGAIGCKVLFDYVDMSKFTGGFIPFFYVPWTTALGGLAVSVLIGIMAGFFPAVRAAQLSVVNGLRKVV